MTRLGDALPVGRMLAGSLGVAAAAYVGLVGVTLWALGRMLELMEETA